MKLTDYVKQEGIVVSTDRMCRVCRLGNDKPDLLKEINEHLKNKTSYPNQIIRFLKQEYKITIPLTSFRHHIGNDHHVKGRIRGHN